MYVAFFSLVVIALILLVVASVIAAVNRRFGMTRVRPSPWIYVVGAIPGILFFMILRAGPAEVAPMLTFLALGGVIIFAIIWVREIVQLMGLGDDAFPGRHDKMLWLALIVVLPPIGISAFSIFRRAYWPANKPVIDVASRDLA